MSARRDPDEAGGKPDATGRASNMRVGEQLDASDELKGLLIECKRVQLPPQKFDKRPCRRQQGKLRAEVSAKA